jgi:hypothetical protein
MAQPPPELAQAPAELPADVFAVAKAENCFFVFLEPQWVHNGD